MIHVLPKFRFYFKLLSRSDYFQHVVATAKMSALPDKGEKLMRQVEDVERALKAVSRKIDNTMQTMRSNKTGQDTGSNNNPAATQGIYI